MEVIEQNCLKLYSTINQLTIKYILMNLFVEVAQGYPCYFRTTNIVNEKYIHRVFNVRHKHLNCIR